MNYNDLMLEDSVLNESSRKHNFDQPEYDISLLIDRMKAVMIDMGGIGISAIQLGVPVQVFLMGNPKAPDEMISIINPIIVDIDTEGIKAFEGCLSFPHLYLNVTRPASIKVRFADVTGEVHTKTFSGMTARIFQHEYDHLQGDVMLDKVGAVSLKLAKQKAAKTKKKLSRKSSL